MHLIRFVKKERKSIHIAPFMLCIVRRALRRGSRSFTSELPPCFNGLGDLSTAGRECCPRYWPTYYAYPNLLILQFFVSMCNFLSLKY